MMINEKKTVPEKKVCRLRAGNNFERGSNTTASKKISTQLSEQQFGFFSY